MLARSWSCSGFVRKGAHEPQLLAVGAAGLAAGHAGTPCRYRLPVMEMDMQMPGLMVGWMALWGLLVVALLVLAVVATVWLVKDLTSHGPRSSPAPDQSGGADRG